MSGDYTQFALPLLVLGVVCIVSEIFIKRWRGILVGLGVNLIAAATVILIQSYYKKEWNAAPVVMAVVVSLSVGALIAYLRLRPTLKKTALLEAEVLRLAKDLENTRADNLRIVDSQATSPTVDPSLMASGLKLYSRNYADSSALSNSLRFHDVAGRDFGDYVRRFVTESPPGSTFKILGIDWTELFGAAVSGTSERYTKLLSDHRTRFQVLLLDPRTSVPLEKRLAEYKLESNGSNRYERNFPYRVYGKIIGSTEMMTEHHRGLPLRFRFRFVDSLPAICCVMNGTQMLFHPYTICHKGWDSPVFLVDKVEDGLYGFYEEYFDFLWENPRTKIPGDEWLKAQEKLSADLTRFEALVEAACEGPAHRDCPATVAALNEALPPKRRR